MKWLYIIITIALVIICLPPLTPSINSILDTFIVREDMNPILGLMVDFWPILVPAALIISVVIFALRSRRE